MTLLEILIVLGILSALVALGLPRFRLNQNNIKKITREMGVLGREIRSYARLKNNTHRLVFVMDGKQHSYWVEAASGPALIPSKESLQKTEELPEEERPKSQFAKVERFNKEAKKLPSGLYFGSIETEFSEKPITEGTAYIYFSPEGLVERSAIQITNREKMTWTIMFNPLTGHADIFDKAVTLKEQLEQ